MASAESTGAHELLLHTGSARPHLMRFDPIDELKLELEMFADAVEKGVPFPVSAEDMLRTVGAFEAVVQALESGETITLADPPR